MFKYMIQHELGHNLGHHIENGCCIENKKTKSLRKVVLRKNASGLRNKNQKIRLMRRGIAIDRDTG